MRQNIHSDSLRLLIERRAGIYSKVAALIMDIEGAINLDDWERAHYHLEDMRRILRVGLAFLTDEVYEELERIEATCSLGTGAKNHRKPKNVGDLRDQLQLLHVKLSRSLKVTDFQDLEDIVGMDVRLKRKLKASRQILAGKVKEREVVEQSWEYEGKAREFLAQKQPKKALKALLQAIKLDPNRAVFHNDLGYVYGVLGQAHKAVAEYREAVRVNEQFAERRSDEWMTSYFNLGIALRKLTQKTCEAGELEKSLAYSEEAIRCFENYLNVMPTGPKVSFTRSVIVQLSELSAVLEDRLSSENENEAAAEVA
ncbi:MAG: tetratricopeptide repeat protein [Planctomycetota bacterium]|nr:tetratricopeptide repeat protein [Planctomycetota bacterium]